MKNGLPASEPVDLVHQIRGASLGERAGDEFGPLAQHVIGDEICMLVKRIVGAHLSTRPLFAQFGGQF